MVRAMVRAIELSAYKAPFEERIELDEEERQLIADWHKQGLKTP